MARFKSDDRFMVRRVPVNRFTVDVDNYEIVNRATGKRDWIGDVYATKETAQRLCTQMNKEVSNDVQAKRAASHDNQARLQVG